MRSLALHRKSILEFHPNYCQFNKTFLEAEATQWHHKLIKRGLEVGSDLLEVGPGNGALAQLAVKLGYKVTLVEESELLAKNLENIDGVKIINRNFEESKNCLKFL